MESSRKTSTRILFALICCFSGGVQSKATDQDTTITDLVITSDVTARFANVVVKSTVVNYEDTSRETRFVVQIPNTAFISNFTMLIGDDLIVGQVRDKNQAQKIYEEAKNRGESAGQVSHKAPDIEREMEVFDIDINVANKSSVIFELEYQELIKRSLGKYVQRISVQPGQVVKNLMVEALYNEPQGFEYFEYSLPNANELLSQSTKSVQLRATPHRRELAYHPSVTEQSQIGSSVGLNGEFIVKYDIPHGNDGGLVLVNDNYFVHYFSPSGLKVLDKNIVFVIDISGSMGGAKIAQAREAMLSILGKLRYHDHFNIILFDSVSELWSEDPKQATENNIAHAKSYVLQNVKARGGTNINDALLKALSILDMTLILDGNMGNIIVFLTDGRATSGETNTKVIRKNVRFANEARISLYSLGFGFNVDFHFLKTLSWENGGFARRIYEESDAAEQLKSFYEEIGSPLLVDVNVDYDYAVIDRNDVTDVRFSQYNNGSELVVAGRIKSEIPTQWRPSVNARGIDGLTSFKVLPQETQSVGSYRQDFTERLWAYMKINSLIKEADISDNAKASAEMKTRALNMSLQYNFVTPLTSMVVVDSMKNEQRDENNMESSHRSKMNIATGSNYGTLSKNNVGPVSSDSISGVDGNTLMKNDKLNVLTVLMAIISFVVAGRN